MISKTWSWPMLRMIRSSPLMALWVLLLPADGTAAPGPLGAGIILGEPSGLSIKLFLDARHAVDAALDLSFVEDAVYVHADYLMHFSPIFIRGGAQHPILPYVGFGGLIGVAGGDQDHNRKDEHRERGALGVRVPLGLTWMPRAAPIDVFLELVPGLIIIPETNPKLDAGLGIRYYF